MDWVVLVLLLSFTIRGLLRGTVAQVFAFFGLVVGVFAGAWILNRVGVLWHDARPAFAFALLRGVVALFGGLAIAAVFGWCGELVAKAIHDGPLGWLDRLVGGVLGCALGAALAAVVLLAFVQGSGPRLAHSAAARSLSTRPLVAVGARITEVGTLPVPGAGWLHTQFVSARHRLLLLRSS